jgi:hypothetical protein
MAVADVSAAYQNPVGPLLKGLEDKVRRDPARTHYPNHPDIGWILHPTDTGEIGAGIGTPVTTESNDFGFKLSSHWLYSPVNTYFEICSSNNRVFHH